MFEDRHIFKFVCIFLGVMSIIIPGPIIPIISFIIAIAMFVYKVKKAKESTEGFESLMLDIIVIAIIIIINIGIFVLRISIENEYNKYQYSSSSSQEYTTSELVEQIITSYQIKNFSQFTDGTRPITIKNKFKEYLENELNIANVTIKGNKLICYIGKDRVTFTVTETEIKYSIK